MSIFFERRRSWKSNLYNSTRTFSPESLNPAHRINEQTKNRAYNRRVNTIDQQSFTPLVFTCFGDMSRECSTFYNRLAGIIVEKRSKATEKILDDMQTKLQLVEKLTTMYTWFQVRKTNI